MKKMIVAFVAMVMMTMSTNAQSDNNKSMTLDGLSRYLELRVDQVEPVRTTLAQFNSSMEAYYQMNDAMKGGEAWEKIKANHKKKMKKILTEQQYEKYVDMLELTAKNAADRIMEQQMANK